MSKKIMIVWRPQSRRAKSLSEDIEAELFLAPNNLRNKYCAPLRYLYLSFWTLLTLLRKRPCLVIATSPPSICPIVIFLYTRVAKNTNYIIDMHHAALVGYWKRLPFGFWLNKLVMDKAMFSIMHNECIKSIGDENHITSVVLETKIPKINRKQSQETCGYNEFSILVPCSFDSDEPIEEIYKAAEVMNDVNFYLTGNHLRLKSNINREKPLNVMMTGYLTDEDYDLILNRVKAVLAFTTNDYPVRPRAASEAIAAAKPLIASYNDATKKDLHKGTVLIDNTYECIVNAIQDIAENYNKYCSEIKELKREREAQYEKEMERFKEMVSK